MSLCPPPPRVAATGLRGRLDCCRPRLRYKYGTYTLEIHGSSNFSGRCDVVNITVPASVWAKSSDPETVQQELKDAFAMVDVDGSGEIDQGELRGLAQMLGMELTNADLVGNPSIAPAATTRTCTLSFNRLRVH